MSEYHEVKRLLERQVQLLEHIVRLLEREQVPQSYHAPGAVTFTSTRIPPTS